MNEWMHFIANLVDGAQRVRMTSGCGSNEDRWPYQAAFAFGAVHRQIMLSGLSGVSEIVPTSLLLPSRPISNPPSPGVHPADNGYNPLLGGLVTAIL